MLLGVVVNTVLFQTGGLRSAFEGLGLALLIYLPLYLLRGVGAGDVKLMAAVGAIAGPANWLRIFFLTVLFGAVAAIVLVVAKRRLRRTFQNIWIILTSLISGQAPYKKRPELDVRSEQGIRLPHAVSVACGSLAFIVAQTAGISR